MLVSMTQFRPSSKGTTGDSLLNPHSPAGFYAGTRRGLSKLSPKRLWDAPDTTGKQTNSH